MAGQNIEDTHFQAAEHEISPANVGRLAPRWTLTLPHGWAQPSHENRYSSTPFC